MGETAQWVEAFSFIDQLFEFAAMANNREWDEGLDAAFDLLRWGFEAGGKLTGWDTLQSALTAAGALTLLADPSLRVRLLARVPAAVASNKAPSLEILARTARGLRARAASGGRANPRSMPSTRCWRATFRRARNPARDGRSSVS